MASKKSRRLAAARAAKRIPIAGSAIAFAPALRAAVDSGLGTTNFTQPATLRSFMAHLILKYTGFNPDTGNFEAAEAIKTFGPAAAYLLARKFGLSKPISRALGRFGLRF